MQPQAPLHIVNALVAILFAVPGFGDAQVRADPPMRVIWPLIEFLVLGDSTHGVQLLASPSLNSAQGRLVNQALTITLPPVSTRVWAAGVAALVESIARLPPRDRTWFATLALKGNLGRAWLRVSLNAEGTPEAPFDMELFDSSNVPGAPKATPWAVAASATDLLALLTTLDAVAERMRRGGRLIYLGAGTSGRLGLLDAAECPPTFNAPPGQVTGVIAGGPDALTRSVEGAEDDTEAGRQAVAGLDVKESDSVVGIAASGRTPYVVAGLEEARRRGALTVALTCNLPAPLAEQADYVLAPLVGPEVITGSTRLKAGTAQKLTLNMLSTAVMVRLGKTYGNLMVDVRALNAKLRARARRIVAQACQIDDQSAEAVLARSDGEVKVAIVSHLAGCSPQAARDRLARAGGVMRAALEACSKKT